MNTRVATTAFLTMGVMAVVTAVTAAPAAAQGDPVYGEGNVYYLSGALNDSGIAQEVFAFGDPDDEVYFGDWYGEDVDLPMVRRGNIFFVPDLENPNLTATVFSYGDEGDEVYVGDWDGDGIDSLTVRRDNRYFVKNDNRRSGVADTEFVYGDAVDTVLVGNWNGQLRAPVMGQDNNGDGDYTDPFDSVTDTPADVAPVVGKGDTLMVVRGNRFFVKNDLQTGVAEYTFLFGDRDDEVLVGDWVTIEPAADGYETVQSGNGADQLAVRRGNTYYQSSELAGAKGGVNPSTVRVFGYGEPDDAVFVASLPTPVDDDGQVVDWDDATGSVTGDGLGVRRSR
jgi:hypothetical protein